MTTISNEVIATLLKNGGPTGLISYLRATGVSASLDPTSLLAVVKECASANDGKSFSALIDMATKADLSADTIVEMAVVAGNARAHAQVLQCLEHLDDRDERFGVLEMKARAYRGLGQLAEAETVYHRMQKAYGTTARTWESTAAFYAAQHDSESEAAALMEALKFKLKDLRILKRLALLAGVNSKHRESLELWRQILRLAPNDPDAVVGVFRQLLRLKNVNMAQSWLSENAKHMPQSDEVDKQKSVLGGLIAQTVSSAD